MASNPIARYVWLIDQIRQHDGISKAEIDRLWANSNLNEGYGDDKIPTRTFRNYIIAIEEIFDIVIECKRKGGYLYYIADPEALEGDRLKNWMIDTFSTLNQMQSTPKLANRIQYENIPSGHRFLTAIIDAMRRNAVIRIAHRSFGSDETHVSVLEPYAVKVFNRRWYMIANKPDINQMRTYGLDRILSIETTEDTFEMPKDFNLDDYFEGSCGIIADKNIPIERIVVRIYGTAQSYIESLPLHESQKQIAKDEHSTTYEYRVRPDFNFYQAIFSQISGIEILEPASVRQQMYEYAKKIMENHR